MLQQANTVVQTAQEEGCSKRRLFPTSCTHLFVRRGGTVREGRGLLNKTRTRSPKEPYTNSSRLVPDGENVSPVLGWGLSPRLSAIFSRCEWCVVWNAQTVSHSSMRGSYYRLRSCTRTAVQQYPYIPNVRSRCVCLLSLYTSLVLSTLQFTSQCLRWSGCSARYCTEGKNR